ncbi:hypothetical protein BDW72DRAFT_186367 [Aspergillus terricola var. indicus]
MDRISSSSSSPSTSPLDQSSINDLVTEINDFSFYHHPSWPQQWSHPKFTSDCEDRWREAPWFEQTKERYTTRFLSPFLESKFPWGYIIYRTVYTSESDKQWPLALKKLDWALDYGIDSDLDSAKRKLEDMTSNTDPEPESMPEQLIKESRKHVVFSNKKFWDGASIEQIRAHFKQYLRASKGRGYGRFEGCLMIDEHSLKSIVAASSPRPRLGEGFVGMVDGRYPEETGNELGYKGFMRVFISSLWFFYGESETQSMRSLCPKGVPEGLIPVYDEGTGTAHDEKGNAVKVYRTQGRNRGRRVF